MLCDANKDRTPWPLAIPFGPKCYDYLRPKAFTDFWCSRSKGTLRVTRFILATVHFSGRWETPEVRCVCPPPPCLQYGGTSKAFHVESFKATDVSQQTWMENALKSNLLKRWHSKGSFFFKSQKLCSIKWREWNSLSEKKVVGRAYSSAMLDDGK